MTQATAIPRVDETSMREWFRALWAPTTHEEQYEITEVDGEIPRELHGTLLRNGPSQRVLPAAGAEALHLFDGDGLVHGIRFDDGRAHYRGAFVRTETTLLEEEAGVYCLDGVNLPADAPREGAPLRYQPNTNVVYHGGRVLALVENGPPFELEAGTLASRGPWDLDGKLLGMSTTAHPKVDGRTGQMILHGYQPVEPYVQVYGIEPDGSVSMADTVDAPYATMMHDAAITEHYIIFPLAPVIMDFEALMEGRPFAEALSYQPERGMKFGIRRREPGSPTTWIDAPTPGYMFHFGNAYEETDGRIVFDVCFYPDGHRFLDALRTVRQGDLDPGLAAYPTLYEIDPATGSCREQRLDDRSAEFPRCDDRLVGYRNRWGYAGIGRGDGPTRVRSLLQQPREVRPRGRAVGVPGLRPRNVVR